MKLTVQTAFCPRLFIACVAVLLAAAQAAAQDAPERPKQLKARISLLETEADELNKAFKEIVGEELPAAFKERLEAAIAQIEQLRADLKRLQDETYARNEAMLEHDDRLDALAEEVEALWNEVRAIKEVVRQNVLNPNAGYDGGFFISSDQGDFQLKISGFVKPYYALGLHKEWTFHGLDDASSEVAVAHSGFDISSARLRLAARVFKVVQAMVSFDFGDLSGEVQFPPNAQIPVHARYNEVSLDSHSVRFMMAYAEYLPFSQLGIRVGQFKVPFDRETLYLANELTFTARSLMTRRYALWGDGRRYDPDLGVTVAGDDLTYGWPYEMQRGASFGWDRGIQLMGSFKDALFNYAVGVFNGGGPNAGNDNRDVLVAGRVWTDVLGPMPPSMSDLSTSQSPLVSIGAALAYDLPQHRDELDPMRVYNSEDFNVTGDVLFKWMGVSALAAVFYRHSDHGAVFGDEPLQTMGLVGQLAYFNEQTGLEPGVRYSILDENVDLSDDHVHELSFALNYYLFGQNLKVQLEYRGLLLQDKDRSYLAPYGVWYEDLHEIMLMAQAGF